MGLIKRKKCKHCGCLFVPDARNAKRRQFCKKSQCRKAGKKYSQQCWLSKPENRDHFRGPINVERVRQWRSANPGYRRGKSINRQNALQDDIAKAMDRRKMLGRDILNLSPSNKGADDDCKKTDPFKPGAQGAQTVQPARLATGPMRP